MSERISYNPHPEAGRPRSRVDLNNFAAFAPPAITNAVAEVYIGKLKRSNINY